MEKKIYKIKINKKEYFSKNDFFILKNLKDFEELFNPSSEYNIIDDEMNIETICEALINLYENSTRYNLCIGYLKEKIIKQYGNEKGNNRYLGFKINDELNRMAIKEYELKDTKVDLFSFKVKDYMIGLKKIAEKNKALNKPLYEDLEKDAIELEDFAQSVETFDNNDNIENKEDNNKTCCIF